MNFFMSAEVDAEVGDAEHIARNKIDPVLVEALQSAHIEFDLERWSFIAIILPAGSISSYPEVICHHKKKKIFEFRLHLSHHDFKQANEAQRIAMLLDAIERSVDLMSNFKVCDTDRATLRKAVARVHTELLGTQ